jgi:hypothetical protein
MKQTAVEWLLDWMGKNQYFIGNDLLKAVDQAKEMEKQQIIWAHGIQMKGVNNHKCVTGEQYYKETFKSE